MENQIISLEKAYWHAMEGRDYEKVRSLTHFPCIIAGENGVRSVDETSFKKMFDQGESKQLKVLNIGQVEEEVMGDHANIAYIIELEYDTDGEKTSNKCACASTWMKEDGKWVCCLHTESPLKSDAGMN